MSTKIVLVLGNGGREHALVHKLNQSTRVGHIYVSPGNGGTGSMGPRVENVASSDLKFTIGDHSSMVAFCKSRKVDLVVIGPEIPLVDGLSDTLSSSGIPCFGPSGFCSQLEGSKSYSKSLMTKNGIPTASSQTFRDYESALKYVREVDHPIVVKASGLASGKGVLVPSSVSESESFLKSVMVEKKFGTSGDEVVIEEQLVGEEVSYLLFCDGSSYVAMPSTQDHKRLLDNDEGPNTGGMGCYGPSPFMTPSLESEVNRIIVEPTLSALKREGHPFIGVLYVGLMLTSSGPKVLEYNCRFGDPETEVILPLLKSDLYTILESCVSGTLSSEKIEWESGSVTSVIIASGNYPYGSSEGLLITGLARVSDDNGIAYHAGTRYDGVNFYTNGGRILSVTCLGRTLRESINRAYHCISHIRFDGLHYRRDIGGRALRLPVRLGVLGSTRGSDLLSILTSIESKSLNAEIGLIISNKPSAPETILSKGESRGLPTSFVNPKDFASRDSYDRELIHQFDQSRCELIVCIGWMRILGAEFCSHFENRCINVHPSLLPEYPGRIIFRYVSDLPVLTVMDLEVHRAVLRDNQTESGCSVHLITSSVDGGRVLLQKRCPVLPTETAESLKAKVQILEGECLIEVIRNYGQGVYASLERHNTYSQSGVNIDAGDAFVDAIKPLCKSTVRTGCDAELGGFGGLFDLSAAGFVGDDVLLVACDDGVAIEMQQHETVGIDLVAMSVNDLVVQGAEPLFFLDYFATVNEGVSVMKGISEGCRQGGCGLIGGETAEMPQMYASKDYDLAGFAVGAVRRSKVLPKAVNIGDIVLGLSSTGVHLLSDAGVSYHDRFPPDPTRTVGDVLLTPTRIYVKSLLSCIRTEKILALAHITGGGLVGNVPRVLTPDIGVMLDPSRWIKPAVFGWLKSLGNVDEMEMIRTFNCGIGMIAIVSPDSVTEIMTILRSMGETVDEIGIVEARSSGEQIQFKNPMFT